MDSLLDLLERCRSPGNQDNMRTSLRERLRCGSADPAARTGDECEFAGK
jgi:hypothetical protein